MVILLVVMIFLGFKAKSLYDRIDFELSVKKADFSKTKQYLTSPKGIRDLLEGRGQFTLMLTAKVWNKNKISIPINRLSAKIYHAGRFLGEASVYKTMTIPAFQTSDHTLPMTVMIRKELIPVIKSYIATGVPDLDYKGSVTVFGIPIPFDGKVEAD